MVYNLHHPIEYIEKELSKLKPLNYNRFFWWRRWARKKPPLGKKSKLINKITNGDFDYSHYKWQALYTEWEINEKCKDSIDSSHFIELTKIDRNRRKRLLEDFEKDELEKLSLIKKHFCKRFKIGEDTYEEEVVKFGGTLEEFYYYCLKKYKN
tara:strand:+ start:2664 stop:3122 length:459 start_codon:yes stop_codon:yes gene_type:complete